MTESDDKNSNVVSALHKGVDAIKQAVLTLPLSPGVYQMLNEEGEALYIGKAKQLKKRVTAYTRPDQLPNRLKRMISLTHKVQVTLTHTETDALLLESNLIKQWAPPYNILLRDDKSFSYIKLSDHPYPLLSKHRGSTQEPGQYFGPFASTSAVTETLATLFKIFRLRSCSDTEFKQRKRPCLKYHIKQCSAPCVALISQEAYAADVKHVEDFLSQKNSQLIAKLASRMEQASHDLDFERAATYRDQIRALSQIQQQQDINTTHLKDVDIIALAQEGGLSCFQLFIFRNGKNCGTIPYFISHDSSLTPCALLGDFLMQLYENHTPAPELLLNHMPEESDLLLAALQQKFNKKISLSVPKRGLRHKLLDQAHMNARQALSRRLSERQSQGRFLQELKDLFELQAPLKRIEIYDNSHISGTDAYGIMVVATENGFEKKEYRKFAITTPPPARGGDDYAMMREVMTRRFASFSDQAPEKRPDLLLIDGGKGQLSTVLDALKSVGADTIPVVAIAKGPDRNAGRETFFQPNKSPITLAHDHPLLYFLQRLRDEAHRFAIGTHRAKRVRNLESSHLDQIPGIGPTRKKTLLQHFGSSYNVKRAGLEDLLCVKGIDANLARRIYEYFQKPS